MNADSDSLRIYLQTKTELGRGAHKVVYKAFDIQEGTEVAWNQVWISDLMLGPDASKEDRDRMFAEIRVLKALKHKNIMTFLDSWYDAKMHRVNFITEFFTSGTLRQYRRRHKHVDDEVLKRWAWQILCGLVYLHGHNPPIIHRDLKCDNIFINGSDGVVKIGDLGLATMLRARTAPQSVLGTPEFMAPELYEEEYDDRVDVYSYGMALLELATLEYPYSECINAAQIYRKVSLGVRPAGLQKVQCRELAEFINLCIAPRNQRPRSRQLLKHPYFDSIRKTLAPSKSEISLANAAAEALLPHSYGPGKILPPSATSLHPVVEDTVENQQVSEWNESPNHRRCPLSAASSVSGVGSSDAHSIHSQKSNGSEIAVATFGSLESGLKSPYGSRSSSRPLSPVSSSPLATSPQQSPVKSPPRHSELKTPFYGADVGASKFNESTANGDLEYIERDSSPCRCAATDRCFKVVSKYRETDDRNLLSLRLKIKEPDDLLRTVEFQFDLARDTASSVASEMVADLELSPEDADIIADAMSKEVSALSEKLEGKASASLAQTAAALQRGLRDTAMMVASSADTSNAVNEDTPKSTTGPVNCYNLGEKETSAIIRRNSSLKSFHSDTSLASLPSDYSNESVWSSPSSQAPLQDAPARRPLPSPFLPSTAPPSTQPLSRTPSIERVSKELNGSTGVHNSNVGPAPLHGDKQNSKSGMLSPPSGILSPISTSSTASHGHPDKRSLNKLFENLQQIALDREESTTPPPVSGRPPLPPCVGNGGAKASGAKQQTAKHEKQQQVAKEHRNGTLPQDGHRPLLSMRSVPASFGASVPSAMKARGVASMQAADDTQTIMSEKPVASKDRKDDAALSIEQMTMKKPGNISNGGPLVKDKEMLRKQAADAMKQVEMRSLTCLQGNIVLNGKSGRGTPMMAAKSSSAPAKTLDIAPTSESLSGAEKTSAIKSIADKPSMNGDCAASPC